MECPKCCASAYRSRLDEYDSLYSQTHHLHRLRTTNEPPSEVEINYVQNSVLRAIQDDMDNMDARLAELQSAAETLTQERHKLTQYGKDFKSLLNPLRRLPPELLMEIFQHAEWRAIALSCPPLWSSIDVVLQSDFPNTSALDAVLSRSGTNPLHVRILVGNDDYEDPHIRDSMARLRAHSSRWRSLETTLENDAAELTFDILHDSYPLLDRLDIFVERSFSYTSPDLQKIRSSQYPILRTVSLQDSLVFEMDLPWAQLTTLIITKDFSGGLMSYNKALRQCPALQTLQVGFLSHLELLGLRQDESPLVTLPALKNLDTAFEFPFKHLIVPRLEEAHLGVDNPTRDDQEALDGALISFQKLVLRSECALTLTSINLENIRVRGELLDLLALTQNLATLKIRAIMTLPDGEPNHEGMRTIMALFSLLQVPPDRPYLPKLRHLSIDVSKHVHWPYFPSLKKHGNLAKVLQSRWNVANDSGVEKLRTFRVGIFGQCFDDEDSGSRASPLQLDRETEEALQVLMDDGMKISISVGIKLARYGADYTRVDFGNM